MTTAMLPSIRPALRLPRLLAVAAALALVALAGCQSMFDKPPEAGFEQLLHPVTTPRDAVRLEIFHARIPVDQDGKAEDMWKEIDEQCLDPEVRRRLVANGLRAGVVGGTLPAELAALLELRSDPQPESNERVITAGTAVPQVTRRVVQVNRQRPTTIQASEVRDEAAVLMSEQGRLRGRTFRQVEGVYSLRAEAIDGQRVQVRLTPELDHGELRNRYAGSDQGIFLMTPSRDREVFDELAIQCALMPGEVLVLGCLPDAKASLGGVFHTSSVNGRHERKLILVRALESPRSEILAKD
jgi:hypothetical protein